MILRRVDICGFKSFRKRVEVPISSRTTILIGPNDHGKSNALFAFEKLNPDAPFQKEEINDRFSDPSTAYLGFTLELAASDLRAIDETALEVEKKVDESQPPAESKTVDVDGEAVEVQPKELQNISQIARWRATLKLKKEIELIKRPGKALEVKLDDLPGEARPPVSAKVLSLLPKIFLFTPQVLRQLPDTVNAEGLAKNEVMQKVFRLAGIWEQRDRLLSGNTRRNEDELRDASALLTQRIRQNWTQGKDLEFYLGYVGNDIRLTVKDNAKTVTAVADRSEGFTAYFAMRMLLVARTDQTKPHGYVFMFDEPGLNLHPKGQVDLQNVFEDIAQANQIIYSTHSVFLINKNYPDRNHLIFKNEEGSNIDNKPFAGGWARVKEHLGLYLSANFLFADKVLLVEGPTDEIYIPLILLGLIQRGLFGGDINALAIRTTLDLRDMLGQATSYVREKRIVAVLVDGDTEGNERKGKIEQWAEKANERINVLSLADLKPTPCSIEDFLEPQLFIEAVTAACKEALDAGYITAKNENWAGDLKAALTAKNDRTLGRATEDALEDIFSQSISDVWIARKYSEILQRQEETDSTRLNTYWTSDHLRRLATRIWETLELPMRGDVAEVPFTTA